MKKCLFSSLPSNDFGLLTRALPIAKELEKIENIYSIFLK